MYFSSHESGQAPLNMWARIPLGHGASLVRFAPCLLIAPLDQQNMACTIVVIGRFHITLDLFVFEDKYPRWILVAKCLS
jgi:hypothetical protein